MKGRVTGYLLAGIAVLLVMVALCRYALRDTPPEPTTAKTEPAEPQQQHRPGPVFQGLPAEAPVTQPQDLPVTNAATLYRQAFALYDALSKDEKGLLSDWRTNVDTSVEAKVCEKIRPICDLMHEAGTVTNCDWGIKQPITLETRLPFLTPARACARVAVWGARHCRSNDSTHATDDMLSALRLGQSVSQTAMIGCLLDFAIQDLTFSGVASNLSSFRGVDSQRLVAAIADPVYAQAPARAMEQEASIRASLVASLASLPPAEFEKEMAGFGVDGIVPAPEIDQATAEAAMLQIADSERELGKALASNSGAEYQAWLRNYDELQESNPFAKFLLPAYLPFVDKVQRATITREMLIAALAVVETGTAVLSSHPDPATGQPFIYNETADGFELQSGYQTNGVPFRMQFK